MGRRTHLDALEVSANLITISIFGLIEEVFYKGILIVQFPQGIKDDRLGQQSL